MKKTMYFIIKVTHSCNLKCKYCYDNLSDSNINIISMDLLNNMIIWISNFCKEKDIEFAKFVWHGGESLLANIHFFEEVIKLQKKTFTFTIIF